MKVDGLKIGDILVNRYNMRKYILVKIEKKYFYFCIFQGNESDIICTYVSKVQLDWTTSIKQALLYKKDKLEYDLRYVNNQIEVLKDTSC